MGTVFLIVNMGYGGMLHAMESFNQLLSQGAANAWFFIPTAILLGALHGLEPGHSKTMMAAFIIAIRGTIAQAVLLGVSAAFSHSLVIWALAALALQYGDKWNAESTEPYFQLFTGVTIIGMALWMFFRIRRDQKAAAAHSHEKEGPNGGKLIDTGHGIIEVSVFETGVPPRFRLHFLNDKGAVVKPCVDELVKVITVRPDGSRQTFKFAYKNGFLEANEELPEPHEFNGSLVLSHGDHAHEHDFKFSEDDHHHHLHHEEIKLSDGEYQDAHELAHARDITKRFSNKTVTTSQIVLFGLTGGLMPCPAALTVLLVCLQLKQFTLGFTLVLCFSIGLALTMVASGALAAWGVNHASKRFKGFGEFARRAPYISSILLICMGGFFTYMGLVHLP